MDPTSALISQYRAALRMHRASIEVCPADLWTDETFENRFWNLSYHTLFYTHLYLSRSEAAFEPWEKGRKLCQYMGRLPWPPHEQVEIGPPYTREALLEYVDFVEEKIGDAIREDDPEAESGFEWIPFNRFQLHLYNIRHLQHHTGQMIERLRVATGKGVGWVGMA
jgi:hypothetical protein